MKSNRNAFTLIELMIVCAIIAVLAALLFAAMGPVRECSRRAVCLSNLQQIGHALTMYRADYDGFDPSVGSSLTTAQMGFPPPTYSLADGYLKNKSVLICPDFVSPHGDVYLCSYNANYVGEWRFTAAVKKRAMEAVTMFCLEHNRPFDLSNEPRWTTRHIQFLRINGEVATKEVPLYDLDSTNW